MTKGKSRWSELPWEVMGLVVRTLNVGTDKHGRDDWRGRPPEWFIDALFRHIAAAISDPGGSDEEDHLPHWAHVVSNALILLALSEAEKGKEDERDETKPAQRDA